MPTTSTGPTLLTTEAPASALLAPAFAADAYLDRIRYSGRLRPDEDVLEALHRAQAYAIPFENFDILLDRGIALEPWRIFDKLVTRARGGYCFELNGLLLAALEAFGFEPRPLLARVHLSGTPSGRGHMLLLATVAGRPWLADAGFGGPGLRAPIPFELERVARQDDHAFRLVTAEPFGTMLQTLQGGDWRDLYSFDTSHVTAADIAYGNHFTSTHPSSFFTYARVAALPNPRGRVSLFDRTLRIVTDGVEQTQELEEGTAYLAVLRQHFGIDLDAPYAALRPLAPA
jgi:N-hydroxyarylamine O-acetyltransferase